MVAQIPTKAEFDQVLSEAGNKIVVVDFMAKWCGPCKAIAPYIEQLASAYSEEAVFIKVDVDENDETAMWAKVSAMPTFHVYSKGKKIGDLIGARKDALKALLEKHTGKVKEISAPAGGAGGSQGGDASGFGCGRVLTWTLAGLVAFVVSALTVPHVELPRRNLAYTPPVPYSEMTVLHLRSLPFEDIVQSFYQLKAPAELDGEYAAGLLDAGSVFNNAVGHLAFSPLFPGFWLSKAFVGGHGRGYNSFLQHGELKYRFGMVTKVRPSLWDGQPSFELDYKPYKHILGMTQMRDEIREVKPGLYLGLGTFGFTDGKRREAFPFFLTGPHAPAKLEALSQAGSAKACCTEKKDQE